jgi:two-component system response regulator DesR
MVKVLLGHTWRLFREATAAVIAPEPDLTVVADAATSDDVLAQARRFRPDVTILDVALPGTIAIDVLCQRLCEAVDECGILVLLDRRTHAGAALALARLAPRVGILDTDASPAGLLDAVRHMVRGGVVLDARVAVAVLTAENNPLTERERQVLVLAVDGIPTKEIARKLHLSAGTVRNCLSRVLGKTGARTRIEAIRVAQESGWI